MMNTIIKISILVLTVIFTLDDLLGDTRREQIEQVWLNTANSLFKKWKELLIEVNSWFPRLAITGILFLFSAVLYILLILGALYLIFLFVDYIHNLVPTFFVVILTYLVYIIIAIILVILGIIPSAISLLSYEIFLEFINESQTYPIEIQIIKPLLIRTQPNFNENISERNIYYRRKRYSYLIFVYLILGIIISTITSISLLIRLLLYVPFMIVWITFFLPAKILSYLAQTIGNPSYLRVAKYIIVIAGIYWGFFAPSDSDD